MVAGTRTTTRRRIHAALQGRARHLIAVTLADEPGKAADYVDKLHALLVSSQSGGFTIQQTGDASMGKAACSSRSDLAGRDLRHAAAMFILLIVFGAVVAAGMPLLLAGIAIISPSAHRSDRHEYTSASSPSM